MSKPTSPVKPFFQQDNTHTNKAIPTDSAIRYEPSIQMHKSIGGKPVQTSIQGSLFIIS